MTAPRKAPTTADPAAIDLDELTKSLRQKSAMYSAPGARELLLQAAAAVEALSERVTALEGTGKYWMDEALDARNVARTAEAAEGRVAELEGIVVRVNEANDIWFGRAIELAEALAAALPYLDDAADMAQVRGAWKDAEETVQTVEGMRNTLAALPAKALERARARDEAKDQAYLERNHLVAALARLYPSGIARTDIPGWSDDWHGCVYINLPTGQVSYHYHDSHAFLFEALPPYQGKWDGHNKADTHRRLANLFALAPPEDAGG